MSTFFVDKEGGFSGLCHQFVGLDCTVDGPTIVAGWKFDGKTVRVFGDRLGVIPLFYLDRGKYFLVSTDLFDLLRSAGEVRLDDAAIAVFLRLGYYVGNTTPFFNVKRVKANENIEWRSGVLRCIQERTVRSEQFHGSYSEAVGRFGQLFRDSIAIRAAKGIGTLPLSGGRDSRHILLELCRQGVPPKRCVTLEDVTANDYEIASHLTERLGVDLISAKSRCSIFEKEDFKNVLNSCLSNENGWYFDVLPYLDGPTFDGLGGDVLSNGLYFSAERNRLVKENKLRRLAACMLESQNSRLRYVKDELRMRWSSERAEEILVDELERHAVSPNPIKSFVFWNRTINEIGLIPATMILSRETPQLPFLDETLLRFLLSLPAGKFGGPGFHDSVISDSFPAFNDIPFSEKPMVQKKVHRLSRPARVGMFWRRLLNRYTEKPRIIFYGGKFLFDGDERVLLSPFHDFTPVYEALEFVRKS